MIRFILVDKQRYIIPWIVTSAYSRLTMTRYKFKNVLYKNKNLSFKNSSQIGLSLFELIITLTIISLALTMTLANYRYLFVQEHMNIQVNQLVNAIALARNEAVKRKQIITLCASEDQKNCSDNWSAGYMVFVDRYKNQQIIEESQLLRVYPALQGSLTWQSFPRKIRFLQMHPSGFTNHHNGTFIYCPLDKDLNYARAVIVNKTGRTYVANHQQRTIIC